MYLTAAQFNDIHGLRHGFFTRRGGISTGIFAELNCGGRDSAESAAIVDENRRRVALAMDIDAEKLLSTRQVHSPTVVTVKTSWDFDSRPEADAMVTNVAGFGLGVLTADCAPVLFVDPEAQVIGAAHAGWKGAFGGVLEATVKSMEQLGAKREHIRIAVGPCIAQASYQVDATFRERFLQEHQENECFFLNAQAAGKYYFNLPGYAAKRLTNIGIRDVEILGNDTYQEENDFFSFRRSTHRAESDYGRQISVITVLS